MLSGRRERILHRLSHRDTRDCESAIQGHALRTPICRLLISRIHAHGRTSRRQGVHSRSGQHRCDGLSELCRMVRVSCAWAPRAEMLQATRLQLVLIATTPSGQWPMLKLAWPSLDAISGEYYRTASGSSAKMRSLRRTAAHLRLPALAFSSASLSHCLHLLVPGAAPLLSAHRVLFVSRMTYHSVLVKLRYPSHRSFGSVVRSACLASAA